MMLLICTEILTQAFRCGFGGDDLCEDFLIYFRVMILMLVFSANFDFFADDIYTAMMMVLSMIGFVFYVVGVVAQRNINHQRKSDKLDATKGERLPGISW